jgi:patatin-like phospholipase/acyl hydrolase
MICFAFLIPNGILKVVKILFPELNILNDLEYEIVVIGKELSKIQDLGLLI